MSDILTQAKDHYQTAKDGWQEIYRKARDDLNFLSDAPYCQWDQQEASDRTTIGRPALQIDQLTQFVHQVTNDIRMNTPTISVIPSGDGSDIETAEIMSGRIKAIEYKSNADAAYDMAADFSVKSSIGFIRVEHDYVSAQGFEQELKICRVINPSAVMIDPSSIEPDGCDAKFGFVFEEISTKTFKKNWPNATPISFGEERPPQALQDNDKVVIAEYFVIKEDSRNEGLLDDGSIEDAAEGKKYKSVRKIIEPKVLRYKLSGEDVLEEGNFPGKYIPLVPVYGEEAWIEGKRNLYSLIRKSKSAQQMYNLWKSLETELLLKQQQAPVQAAVGQMRGFEDQWKSPDKAMVLYYHQTDANSQPAPPPQRLQPPTIPTGIVNAARETVDDIKATMGMYNASIGQRSNETSGVAIQRRQQEGDVATFHFGDNLVRSITHVGKIIVCALPEIEDSARVVQTVGKEGEIKPIGINGKVVEGQERTYDYTRGEYDVRVITGPPFTTQRQEAAAMYAELVGKMPDLMPIIGDLVFKYQDTPGAQAIASRLKKIVDPKLLDESEREENIDPAMQQMQAQMQQIAQEAQMRIQQLEAELASKQGDTAIKAGELEIKNKEVEIKAGELQLKAMEAQKPVEQVGNDIIAIRELELKEYQARQDAKNDTLRNLIEIEKLKLEAMKLQPAAEPVAEENRPSEAEQSNNSALLGIMQNIEQLTQAIMQPISIIRDEAGNMVGAA